MWNNRKAWQNGIKDGIPICLGYFAVSFALGVAAKNTGLSPVQAFIVSLTNLASAGEYAGFTMIRSNATYLETALMILVTNARYFLMSSALTQKISDDTGVSTRMTMAYGITDEIFGISMSVPGKLNPCYVFGALLVAVPGWCIGTFLGVVLGNILPAAVVSALSVALFGMFVAIIVPPSKKDKVTLWVVICSMTCSGLMSVLPVLNRIPDSSRLIILTIGISVLAAFFFPRKES